MLNSSFDSYKNDFESGNLINMEKLKSCQSNDIATQTFG